MPSAAAADPDHRAIPWFEFTVKVTEAANPAGAACRRGPRQGHPLPTLTGPAVDAVWNPELAPAMRVLGIAIQEESALELIVADLLESRQGSTR